jgi:hypothetical protein
MKRTLIALCTAAITMPGMAADRIERLPSITGDTVYSDVIAMPSAKAQPHHESQAVSFTWLASDADMASWQAPQPQAQSSKSYWQEVKGSELAQGVSVYTTVPGALVRLSAPSSDKGIGTSAIQVLSQGVLLEQGNGLSALADAEALKATGAPFSDGTIAFQLAENAGSGVFQIRAEHAVKSDATYLLQVHEPNSPVSLSLSTDRLIAMHGDLLKVQAQMAEGVALSNMQMTGFVTSPGGDLFPVSFKAAGDGRFHADLAMDVLSANAGQPGELWEVHAVASAKMDGLPVFRDVRTAFTAAVPTAALGSNAQVLNDGESLSIPVTINTASKSRFELRATLFGTDANGDVQAIALTHSAAPLSAGEAKLTLSYPMAAIRASGLKAPYSLRNVELLDQGQMALLSRQQVAFEFNELPDAERPEMAPPGQIMD